MADVAVVIGNHQGERVLKDCLRSLQGQTLVPTETIVADGASSDGSRRVAETFGARFLTFENRGLAYLYNRGIESAAAEYVFCCNNDIALAPRCLELLAAALDADGCRFAADARQLDWGGEGLVHGRATLRRGKLLRELVPGLRLDLRAPADRLVPTVSANGASMLVRREYTLCLGGFDETFFLDFEDLDLCWRAWLRGWSSVYVPDAVVRHRVAAVTTPRVRPRRLASSHHNLTRFALKCLPAKAAAKIVAAELLRVPRHPRIVPPALGRVAVELREIVRLRHALQPTSALLEWMLAGQPDAGAYRSPDDDNGR